MAIDGVVIDMPDTPENNEEFQHSSGGRGPGAFPVTRIVALAECGTHAIVSAKIGIWSTGERTLTPALLDDFQSDMLVLADRGFYSYKLWNEARETGAELLFRVADNMIFPVLELYPDGSYRSVLIDPEKQRVILKRARRRGDGPHGDLSLLASSGTPCRVVEYSVDRGNDMSNHFDSGTRWSSILRACGSLSRALGIRASTQRNRDHATRSRQGPPLENASHGSTGDLGHIDRSLRDPAHHA